MITLDEIRTLPGVISDNPTEAKLKIIGAFKSVLLIGNSTEEQRLLVLAELASVSNYFDICSEMNPTEIATHNGNRVTFAHIVSLAFMPGGEVANLQKMATDEN